MDKRQKELVRSLDGQCYTIKNVKTTAFSLCSDEGKVCGTQKHETQIHRTHHPGQGFYLADGSSHILIDGIGDLCPLHSGFKLHREHSWVMPEPPKVRLVSGQARAVDPRLLACSNAHNLQDTNTNASSSLTPVSRELFCTSPLIYLLIF